MLLKSKLLTFLSLALVLTLAHACKTDKYTQGKFLYDKYCVNCHGENGEQLADLIPPLAKSDYLTQHAADLPCLIYYGYQGKMTVNGVEYNHQMPGNPTFNDIDIANVINYINHSFGNNNGYTTLKSVQQSLNQCGGTFK
jgi:cytochrome c551